VQPIWLFLKAMVKTIPGFTPPSDSPLFCLQDRNVLAHEMEAAAFREVRTTSFETDLALESGDHLWDTLVAGAPALAGLLRGVPDEQRRAIRTELIEAVRPPFDASRPVSLPITFNIGVGAK
jgi:hypothetical protein